MVCSKAMLIENCEIIIYKNFNLVTQNHTLNHERFFMDKTFKSFTEP